MNIYHVLLISRTYINNLVYKCVCVLKMLRKAIYKKKKKKKSYFCKCHVVWLSELKTSALAQALRRNPVHLHSEARFGSVLFAVMDLQAFAVARQLQALPSFVPSIVETIFIFTSIDSPVLFFPFLFLS